MRRAMTLIELLVVIAIIGVMAGLLLPGVRTVSEAAKTMRCGANLRQLSFGAHAYAEDFTFFPPAILWHSSGVGDSYWMSYLTPYLDSSPGESVALYQIRATSVFYGCPNFRRNASVPTSVSYGMTPYPNAPAKETINQEDDMPVNSSGYVFRLYRPGDITHASQRPYIAESSHWSLPASRIARHGGHGMNAVFFDMHVGHLTYDELSAAVKSGSFGSP